MKMYINGRILTMVDEKPSVEALIEDKGRIVFAGAASDAQTRVKGDVHIVDLKGRTLMPALLDAHSHITDTALLLKSANLQTAKSFADIITILRAHVSCQSSDQNAFVVGLGYDHNVMPEKKHPDKFLLDAAFPDTPVVIVHASIHMCVANSAMLNLLHIDAATPEPEGGIIGRVDGSKDPNGYLEETAFNPIYDRICQELALTVPDIIRAQQLYLENGILTIQEGSTDEINIDLLHGAAKAGQLICDVVAYPAVNFGRGVGASFKNHLSADGRYDGCFKIGGYKLLLDGSPQGKSAWLSEPYIGTDDRSYGWLTDKEVQHYTDAAFSEKRQVIAHCNGDAASEQFINACEASLAKYPHTDARPVMIHCQTVRDDQLARMAKMQMIASFFVSHVYYWGDIHLKNLGTRRAHHISPMASAKAKGVPMNIHTDSPVVLPNLFHAIWTSVKRETKNGVILGADERIDVWTALKAVTIDAAYAYFEENEKGSLEPGKRADFVIIDQDPLAVATDAIKDLRVLSCIKEGETVYIRKDA